MAVRNFNPEMQTLRQYLPNVATQQHHLLMDMRPPIQGRETGRSRQKRTRMRFGKPMLKPKRSSECCRLEILAQEYNVFFGKWLIFSSPASVDMDWAKVAEGVVADVLGPVAKFLPMKSGEKTHVICVYTENYFDMEGVKKVRDGLRELGFTRKLQYRTDAFTYCGVYAKNKWGIHQHNTVSRDDEVKIKISCFLCGVVITQLLERQSSKNHDRSVLLDS